MKPYRRRLVGLPIQRSVFADIDRAPALLGLTGVLPDDRLGAWLDEDGDLFLDRANIDRLSNALSERISEPLLAGVERSLDSACRALQVRTDQCHAAAPTASPEEARRLLGELGVSLKALVAFGILSKFVPDVLYGAYATPGTGIPRLPGESPGAALTREAFVLFRDCSDAGFPPDRLLAGWPGVPAMIGERILAFCESHAGFGPLPWEAPGYEDPRYVMGILESSFVGPDRSATMLQLGERGRMSNGDDNVARLASELTPLRLTLRRVIIAWMEFLERETWYVRRAFYVALLPLLARLLPEYQRQSPRMRAEDTLFFEIDELLSADLDVSVARGRREKYFNRTDYVLEQTISDARLAALFDRVSASPPRSQSLMELV